MENIKVNSKNFVEFANKDWSYQGDKGSWAKVKVDDNGKQFALVVKKSAKGIISSDYNDEMRSFCNEHGIDWDSIRCGQQVEVELYQDEAEEQEENENIVLIDGSEVDFDAAVMLMDDEILERLHNELAPCANQEFMDAYVKAHAEKFDEDFVVG